MRLRPRFLILQHIMQIKAMTYTRQRRSDAGPDALEANHQPERTAQLLLTQDVHQDDRLLGHIGARQHPVQPEQHSKPDKGF